MLDQNNDDIRFLQETIQIILAERETIRSNLERDITLLEAALEKERKASRFWFAECEDLSAELVAAFKS